MKTSKEYRVQSKKALVGNWGMAIAVTIIYGIAAGVLTSAGMGVATIVLGGALLVGYVFTMAGLYRKNKIEVEDLLHGFKDGRFGATIVMGVLTSIFTFLWSLLFVIPGIVAAYRYAMAPYILADHPEMSGSEAIEASKKLMDGKKGKLFCLQLSFIGWWILGALTFGILYIWITPWMQAAENAFYEDIKNEVPVAEQTENTVEE